MHKRLYTLFALLLLPVFLVSCVESGSESKVKPEVLAATLQTAMDTADSLDKMNLKAYGLAQVGEGLASVDPARAGQVLGEAMAIVNEVRSDKNKATLAELVNTTSEWPAAEKDQVSPAIDRIEKAVTRTWVIRQVAEGMMRLDRGNGLAVLKQAAVAASTIPDKRYRDLDLRSVSGLMAQADPQSAAGVADMISDARVKAWALTEIGTTAAATNQAVGADILRAAAAVARMIPSQVAPSSDVITEEASQETKDSVLGADAARITAAAARALSGVALAMNPIDAGEARKLFGEASQMAAGIDKAKYPYTRAYAMSDVAMDLANVDPAAALQTADTMAGENEEARFAIMLKAINVKAAKGITSTILTDIGAAEKVALDIEDEFEKAKALSVLGKAAVPFDKAAAAEIAAKIEQPLGHATFAYTDLKNEVLADVAVAWAREDEAKAKEVMDAGIVEPRFARNMVMFTKGKAYLAMADEASAKDAAAAMKLYGKAAGAASEAGSSMLQWEVASGMCKLDGDKLFDFAAKIEDGDFYNKTMALSAVAADWSAKGNGNAGMVWDMAAKSANMLGDDIDSSELLNKVATACAAYDKAKASQIYGMSYARVSKIGMKTEG